MGNFVGPVCRLQEVTVTDCGVGRHQRCQIDQNRGGEYDPARRVPFFVDSVGEQRSDCDQGCEAFVKIGVVIEWLESGSGGAEQWTRQFIHWLNQQGHTVHIVARDVRDSEILRNNHCHRLGRRLSRRRFAQVAEEVLGSLPLDIIHDMGCGYRWDIFQPHGGSRLATFDQGLRTKSRLIRHIKRVVCPFLPRYREFNQLMERQFANTQGLFVALSEMVAEHFRELHGLADTRIRRIYNGVDLDRFTPKNRERFRQATRSALGVADDEVLLMLVAHNQRLKGLPTLIRAAGHLIAERLPVKLAIVGSRRHSPYERMAKRLLGRNRVVFVGAVTDSAPYYAATDIYVHPTYYDPCSLAVLEALASGLPVITSRFNGVAELMTDGSQGYVISDPANDVELADKLRPMLDINVRAKMGHAARLLAEENSLEQNFKRILALYAEVLNRKRKAA